MNKGLLLLFVGVLFVAGSVDAITVKDAERAIHTGWLMYFNLINGRLAPEDIDKSTWNVKLDNGGYMAADCTISGKLMNCGLPNMYKMPMSVVPTLNTWFSRTTNGGVVLKPQHKGYGVYKVNALYRGTYTFNFHIPISNDMKSEVSALLKLLLDRARLQ